jgi:hypothetical protein
MTDAELALAEATAWMGLPGVVAVGEGEEHGEPTIDVWVKPAEVERSFPARLHGISVRIRDSGGDVRAEGSSA